MSSDENESCDGTRWEDLAGRGGNGFDGGGYLLRLDTYDDAVDGRLCEDRASSRIFGCKDFPGEISGDNAWYWSGSGWISLHGRTVSLPEGPGAKAS